MLNEIVKYKKDSILHHLKMTLRLKKDEKLQTILKEIEKKQGIMIFGTEKFKFLQNLAELYEQIEEKLLSIDEDSLFEFEAQIKNISPPEDDNKNTGKGILISIELKKEIERDKKKSKKKEDSGKKALMSVIEENMLYEIKKKYSILDIEKKAADYFNEDPSKYILINDKFQVYPFDLIIYDVILEENVRRGFVQSLCNYFQLNPKVSQGMKFILIQKKIFKEYLYNSSEEFTFVVETPLTREIMTIYQEDKNKISERLNEKQQEDIETLKDILKILYGLKTIRIKSIRKDKQSRKESNISINETMNIRTNLTLKENAIIDQYQSFIDSFGMEYDTFFAFVREIYNTQDVIPDFKKYAGLEDNDDERKSSDDSKPEYDDTFTYKSKKVSMFEELKTYFSKEKEEEKIINVSTYIITYRNNGLIPQNYLKRTFKLSKKETEIKCYKNYIKKRKEVMQKNQTPIVKRVFDFSNKKDNDKLESKGNLIVEMFQKFISLKSTNNPKISIALIVLEIIGIILIYLFGYITADTVSIKEKVFFKEKIRSILDENHKCVTEWKNNIYTYVDINEWIYKCILPLSKYMDKEQNSFFYIPRIDFQIKLMSLKKCEGDESYNIPFYPSDSVPQCFNSTKNSTDLFNKNQLYPVFKYYTKKLGILDRVFSNDRRVPDSLMFIIYNPEDLKKIQNMIESKDANNTFITNEASVFNVDVFFVSKKHLSSYDESIQKGTYALLETFNFNSGDEKKMGNIITTSNSSIYVEFVLNYYTYISYISLILFLSIVVFKAIYKKNKSIIKIITTNVFLILDFIFSFVGATYVSLNSNTEYSLDSFFSSKDQNEFDKDIIKYNTYQIMKSFEILCITYHGVYTLFDNSQVIAYSYFFKSIFLRTMILVFVFSAGIAVILNTILGSYFSCYSTFLYSYLVVLTRLFGYIDLNEENGNVKMKFVNQTLSTIYNCLIGVQILIKVLIIDLFFSYTLYYYKKYHCINDNNVRKEKS